MKRFNRCKAIMVDDMVYLVRVDRNNQVADIQPRDFFDIVHGWPFPILLSKIAYLVRKE